MKLVYLYLILVSLSYYQANSQCDYKTFQMNGQLVKQFNPMPIGGNEKMQVAISISNVDSIDYLLITVRFLKRFAINKLIKITLSDGTKLELLAERIGDDFVGGSPITHMIFNLDSDAKKLLSEKSFYAIEIDNYNILVKTFSDYVSKNLKCFNN